MTSGQQRVLVTVSGPDTLGITAALTRVVAEGAAQLCDIEQVVVQGQLTLCLLIGFVGGSGEPVLKDLLFTAKRMGLDMHFQVLDAPNTADLNRQRYAVTAIGDGLGAAGVSLIADLLARHNANIESIRQLSVEDLESVEIIMSIARDADSAGLRRALIEAVQQADIDIAMQRERLVRRSRRLVVMDMDSTLIRIEVIDELARMHGVVERVSDITRRAMAGELNYEASLRERVALLAGLEYRKAKQLAADLPVTEGAHDMLRCLHTLGYRTAVISGGFTFAANALKEQLGLAYAYANQLEVRDGLLTGGLVGPIVSPERKADLLDAIAQREGISLEQTIAIGDGANDLAMLDRAGLGIAFHAKAKLKAAADTAVSAGGLDRILYLLGLHARDVRELLDSQ